MEKWIRRWCMWTSAKAALPGVWRRRDGGYVVRGRAKDPRTGKRVDVVKALPDAPSAKAALSPLRNSHLQVVRLHQAGIS
jgi:hypothetical protein